VREKRFRRRMGRSLSFKGEYVGKILSGEKTSTVRRGILVPRYSEISLRSQGGVIGRARIESVKYTQVKDLTDSDAVLDGFRNREELVSALEKHYPGIGPEDWVTVIRFRLLREEPVDLRTLARLALAYGLARDDGEYRVLSAVGIYGGLEEAVKVLRGAVDKRSVERLLDRVRRELKEKGLV